MHCSHSYPCTALLFYIQDRNVLPIYAEIIGAQPTNAKSAIVAPRSRPASGIIAAPRSRPPSGVPLGPITKAPSSSGSGTIVLEGRYLIKETGLFAGWLWKDRWVSLTSQGLVIHSRAFKVRSYLPYLSPSFRLLVARLQFCFISSLYQSNLPLLDYLGILRFQKNSPTRSHSGGA